MKPRKKIEGKKWENPTFDKGIVAPVERFWYECEKKGLKTDSEIEQWLYDIVNYAYRVGCANQQNAIKESFKNNISHVYSAITNDSNEELNKMHEHFNKNIG